MTIEEIKQIKSITKADIKFLDEFILEQGDDKTFINDISGETFTCTGFLAGIIKFVFDIEGILANTEKLQIYHDKLHKKNSIQKFDRAKNLILKLNNEAYMKLID